MSTTPHKKTWFSSGIFCHPGARERGESGAPRPKSPMPPGPRSNVVAGPRVQCPQHWTGGAGASGGSWRGVRGSRKNREGVPKSASGSGRGVRRSLAHLELPRRRFLAPKALGRKCQVFYLGGGSHMGPLIAGITDANTSMAGRLQKAGAACSGGSLEPSAVSARGFGEAFTPLRGHHGPQTRDPCDPFRDLLEKMG